MRFRQRPILFLAFALIMWTNPLTAQPDIYKKIFKHQKDSLVKELNKYPAPDTSRVMALINILDYATFLFEKREVMPYWKEALRLSRTLAYKRGEAVCLNWIGGFYKSEHKTDSALLYLDSSILIVGNATDLWSRRVKGFALFQKAMMYEGQDNLYNALNSYFESIKCYDSADLDKQKNALLRIATIYQRLLNEDKALEYYTAALELYKKIAGDKVSTEAEGLNTYIASIYFNKGQYATAKYYLEKLHADMPDTVETMVTGGYYHLAAQIAMKENQIDSSIRYFKESLKYYNFTKEMHMDVIADVCGDIARLKMQTGDLAEAKKYATQSLSAANESGKKETIADALIVMAEYYNKTGNQSAAYQTLHHATILSDSVLRAANIRQANTLSAIYENDKKEKAIAQLEIDKKIQSASVRQKALLNSIFIITIVALLLISSILYLNFKSKQKIERQKIAELEKEKQLMGIEAMLKGQEDERRRLARDLHDGLGSMLSGVKISFSTMKESVIMDAANTLAFEKALAQLDRTIIELRKVAHNLMPEALVRFGLKSAVKDFCESIRMSGNTQIICEQFGTDRELGNIADVNVYRIIQELVNNAMIHGKADQILVQLTKTDEKVLITVEDNGKGFEVSALGKSTGIGWTNIQSRVNYFNGITDIASKPGEGTTLNIELIT